MRVRDVPPLLTPLIMKYKIKSKYKAYIVRWAWTKLNLDGEYTKEEWNNAGFKDVILEAV
jgi:hypothetical protein